MRLQKQISRQTARKEYSKYVVVIPPERIEELGWRKGLELEVEVRGSSLTLKPSRNRGYDHG
jgi:antitoxin component of MazEF toxin-antitoxin module